MSGSFCPSSATDSNELAKIRNARSTPGFHQPTAALATLRAVFWTSEINTGTCFEIAERPPAAPSYISARMRRDFRIRYSTVGVVPSSNSADPS